MHISLCLSISPPSIYLSISRVPETTLTPQLSTSLNTERTDPKPKSLNPCPLSLRFNSI